MTTTAITAEIVARYPDATFYADPNSSHWEPIEEPGDIICTYGEHRADVPAVAILSTAEGTWDGSAACEHHINEPRAF